MVTTTMEAALSSELMFWKKPHTLVPVSPICAKARLGIMRAAMRAAVPMKFITGFLDLANMLDREGRAISWFLSTVLTLTADSRRARDGFAVLIRFPGVPTTYVVEAGVARRP